MRNILIAAALSLALVSDPVSASAQPRDMVAFARVMADELRPTLPRPFGDRIVLSGVRSEGPLLILTIEVRSELPLDPDNIAQIFSTGFCRGARMPSWFEDGLRMRVDISRDGRTEPGTVISSCPAAR